MTRRPLHGETGGEGIFDVHLDEGDVIEIDAVCPGGVVLIETGTFVDFRAGLGPALSDDETGYVTLDLRQLEDLIKSLQQARDYLREHSA